MNKEKQLLKDLIEIFQNQRVAHKLDKQEIELAEQTGVLYYLSKHCMTAENLHFVLEKINQNKSILNFRLATLKKIVDDLNDHHCEFIIIKGMPFAQFAYGDYSLRTSNDIDLLVSIDSISMIKEVLTKHGFILGKYDKENNSIIEYDKMSYYYHLIHTHQLPNFIKIDQGIPISIDINYKLAIKNTDDFVQELFDERQYVMINNTPVITQTLETMLITICLHHYFDMNSPIQIYKNTHGFIRMIFEIAIFIKNNKFDYEKILYLVKKHNLESYISSILNYINLFFPIELVIPKST